MKKLTIVILATEGQSTNMLYNALNEDYEIQKVIFEEPISKVELVKRRLKKFSIIQVIGQLLFQILYLPFLRMNSSTRIESIRSIYRLNNNSIPKSAVMWVSSINNADCHAIISALNPDAFVLSGTRILSGSTLENCHAPVVNIHAGITPFYRGVHGGYWALANNEPQKCGVTLHIVDTGIDTGNILAQSKIEITNQDNFATYPILQLAKGIELLKNCLPQFLNHTLIAVSTEQKGQLWYHPTIWQYLAIKRKKGVA
jgi:methionyl-tRNA formyltransferase